MNPIARKLTALSLAAVMGLGLAACGNDKGTDSTGDPNATGSANAEQTSYADQIVVGITAEPKYIEPNAPGMGPPKCRCPSRSLRVWSAPATTAPLSLSWPLTGPSARMA